MEDTILELLGAFLDLLDVKNESSSKFYTRNGIRRQGNQKLTYFVTNLCHRLSQDKKHAEI